MWGRSFHVSIVRRTFHTHPDWKRSFSNTLLKPEKFAPAMRFSVNEKHFVNWGLRKWWCLDLISRLILTIKDFLKLFYRHWLLLFHISLVYCEHKTFDTFSEWNYSDIFKIFQYSVDGALIVIFTAKNTGRRITISPTSGTVSLKDK